MSKKNNPKRDPPVLVEENEPIGAFLVIETIITNVPQPTSRSIIKSQSAAQSQPTSQTAWFSQSPIPTIEQPNATESSNNSHQQISKSLIISGGIIFSIIIIGAAVYFYRQKNGLDEKPSVLEINDQDTEKPSVLEINDQDPESLESNV